MKREIWEVKLSANGGLKIEKWKENAEQDKSCHEAHHNEQNGRERLGKNLE